MPLPFQHLVITDGTTDASGIRNEVDLLSPSGFCLLEDGDWRPAIAQIKGGGVWKDSQLADGRRPADFKYTNVVETMVLTVTALDQNQLVKDTQELRRLLNKARSYGLTDWQTEPVWIEAQSPGESNMRYTIIWDWSTPNDSNPYEEPFFQALASAGMDDFTLSLEREPFWRDTVPGSSTCLEIAGAMEWAPCRPFYLEYPLTSSRVNCGSNAALNDLPDSGVTAGTMTWECWIRFDYADIPAATTAFIASKHVGVTGWYLGLTLSGGGIGFWGRVSFAPLGQSTSGLDDVPTDGLWHHVAMTWDDAWAGANRYPRLWVDGIEVTYFTTAAAGAPYSSDASNDLYIGNDSAHTNAMPWDMGWCRLSNQVLYNAPFAPPARCVLPADVPGVTIGQWIGAESTGATIDNQEGTAALDGTQTNCTFNCDCVAARHYGSVDEYGVVVPTCSEIVYVANKQNMANISDVWYWDVAAGWTGNLAAGALPYTIITPNAINNYVIFGIDTTMFDSGPFCSLVFDLGTPALNLTYQWEYWNGAWVALTVQDNTNADGLMSGIPLDTAGVRSVHWVPPADWVPVDPGCGVTGYWVRLLITASPPFPQYPVQQNRHIYTITWPYIEVQDGDIGGDVTALLAGRFRAEADHRLGAAVDAWSNRMILGLRSLSRGTNFAAYINLADEQNPSGITVTPSGGGSAFVTNTLAPSGRCVDTGNVVSITYIDFDYTIAHEYVGKFHVFLRGRQNAGAAGQVTFRLFAYAGGRASIFYDTGELPWPYANAFQIADLGVLNVPREMLLPNSTLSFELSHRGNGISNSYLYDLILLPVDEWAVDILDWGNSGVGYNGNRNVGATTYGSTVLDIDGIAMPKLTTYLVERYDQVAIHAIWQAITSSYPMLQSNADQRLWTLSMRYPSTVSDEFRSELYVSFSVWCDAVRRYFSMRGNR